MAFFDRYRGYYSNWRRQIPHQFDMAGPEERSVFEECVADGLMFEATLDGHSVGYAAVKQQTEFCMTGYCLVDIVLDPTLCGEGLGSAMLRSLMDQLDPADHALLFAHVHARNVGSMRAAQAVGLRSVGTVELFRID